MPPSRLFSLLLALAALLPATTGAQPINDLVFTAAPIVADGSYSGSNVDATAEAGANPTATCTTIDGRNSVWWVFRPFAPGAVTIDLAGSTFDTVLSIVSADLTTQLDCDDDGVPGDGILTSRIEDFLVNANQLYYIRVTGFNGAEGDITLDFSSDPVSLTQRGAVLGAPYDFFNNVLNLNGDGALIGFDETYPESNVGTTVEDGELVASCATIDGRNSTWRRYAPVQSGFVTIDLAGSTFDTVLVIASDDGTQLACDDDGIPGDGILTSRIENFPMTAGQIYHIRVTGFNGAEGDITMRVVGNATPVSADRAPEAADFTLLAPSPNPASGAIRVGARLASPADIRVAAYDALGREVAEIASGPAPAGETTWTWETHGLPAGVYVVRLASGKEVQTQRVTVIR